MSSRQRTIAFIVMTIGMFMASLDIQIVTSSVREIQAGLAATADEVALVQTSYLIAEVIMIPLSGWLSRMASTRWLFTASAAGFTLASIGCGLAWNLESMIAFRAIQGFVGGAMIPTVFAAGFAMFPGPAQTRIPAVLGLVATLAPALGPTIGGWITQTWSWRWLFFINIVPGLLILAVVPRLVRIDEPDLGLLRRFDAVGALLLAVFLGTLQYTLDEGPRRQWLEDPLLQVLAPVSAAAGVLFVWRSLGGAEPLVELRAFRHRNFALGCALSFAIGVGLYGSIYLTPVFLGQVRGQNALDIGTTVFAVGLANIAATPVTVALLRRVSLRTLLLVGFALFVVSSLMFTRIDASWSRAEVMLPQVLRGVATMVCIIPVTGLALGALAADEVKGGSGLYNLMRNLGGAIGLAVINSQLFYDRLHFHAQRLEAELGAGLATVQARADALAPLLQRMTTDDDRATRALLALISRLGQREALTLSFVDVFTMLALFFVAPLLLACLIDGRRPAAAASTADSH